MPPPTPLSVLALTAVLIASYFVWSKFSDASFQDLIQGEESEPFEIVTNDHNATTIITNSAINFPKELLKRAYNAEKDFINEQGIVPSFWNEATTWGPCYSPDEPNKINWKAQVKKFYGTNKTSYHPIRSIKRGDTDVADYCRPGFVIIGAGKCGTSSLYHYLVGHPRVLPAQKKQIHYFKYHTTKPVKWYLSHFPTATSFLSAGALMTGEASPGYLPYPDVAQLTARRMPGTKILMIGRHPVDRAWSSYNYNYVNPTLNSMWKGKISGIPRGKSDEFYRNHLFSFEDLVRAELKQLGECFAPGGPGSVGAKMSWGSKSWAKAEFRRRHEEGLPPLIDLDGHCYGKKISPTVPRKQWKELLEANPEKVIDTPNVFLTQALLGRSLYVFPLEWWYMFFPKEDIYFVCTEELRDMSGESMNQVGQFLGLPSHNFSSIVGEGAFNVGGHKGYDKATGWDEVQKKQHEKSSEIPLSSELLKELEDFIEPYNERLFELVGRRCDW